MDKFCSCFTHLANNVGQRSDEQLSGFDHETVFKAVPLIDAPVVASFFPLLTVVDEGVRPVELLNDGVLHSFERAAFLLLALACRESREKEGYKA